MRIIVLGTTQDGGYPHAGCNDICCKMAWGNSKLRKYVASIAIVDDDSKQFWIIDITPDFKEQFQIISKILDQYKFSGIFLTHAHVGHYSGLLTLGLEVMNTKNIPVYAMPRLVQFLKNNSSIDFLINSKNIVLYKINEKESINPSDKFSISSFLVPHRNEMSETVGYAIKTKQKSVIYIPDIDSWDDWDVDVVNIIKKNDLLFLDGTFYDKSELKIRNIEKIPHPSILESLNVFDSLDIKDKKKIYFTHLNHTNNVLRKNSFEYKQLIKQNFNILEDKTIFKL